MEGTNKVVNDIVKKFLEDLSSREGVSKVFHSKLSAALLDEKKVTAQMLEQLLYEEDESI